MVNDLDDEAARSTVREVEREGGTARAYTGELTDPTLPPQLVQFTVDAFQRLDILVNNAGYLWNGAMHNHTDEPWQAMLDMHATAPFRVLRAFYPVLKAQFEADTANGGTALCRKVVNISSASARAGRQRRSSIRPAKQPWSA